jgi:GNAT superfamily N-acetyltransferase
MSTKYWQYMKEREGTEVIETPHGFITHKPVSADTWYLVDIWVSPEMRRSQHGTELLNLAIELAKQNGIKRVIGSCAPSSEGSTASIIGMIKHGFKLHSAQSDMIYLAKDI